MARKSRKQTAVQQNQIPDSAADYKVYRTALYARLSADEHCRTEGTTIENQLYLLRDYVKDKPYLQVIEEYFDDGVIGTRFDRPDFTRMIEDMRAGHQQGSFVQGDEIKEDACGGKGVCQEYP